MAVLGRFEDIESITNKISLIKQCENHVLEATIVGAAYSGYDKKVFSLLEEVRKQELSDAQFNKLSKMGDPVIMAAAEGGHLALVNKLIAWFILLDSCNKRQEKIKDRAIIAALEGGKLELDNARFARIIQSEKEARFSGPSNREKKEKLSVAANGAVFGVMGDKNDKHNQKASTSCEKDGFETAVRHCFEQLKIPENEMVSSMESSASVIEMDTLNRLC